MNSGWSVENIEFKLSNQQFAYYNYLYKKKLSLNKCKNQIKIDMIKESSHDHLSDNSSEQQYVNLNSKWPWKAVP